MKFKLIISGAISVLVIGAVVLLSKCLVIYSGSPSLEKRRAFVGKWESSLSNCVLSATQLIICDSWTDEEIVVITNKSDIVDLISAIDVDEAESDYVCFCSGTYKMVFMQESNELATVCVHDEDFPGARLDWTGGEWPVHGVLTSKSSTELYIWLATHDVERDDK
jgi:hypothetical protein